MMTQHVPPASRASEIETSDVSVTSVVIFHCLDASDTAMTLSAIALHHNRPSFG
jgi:hypothetical protein